MVPLNRSKELFDSINSFTAGGVHSNYRTFLEHPLFFDKGRGSKIFDVDGNEYIDFIVNFGACILGLGYPDVVESIIHHVKNGLASGVETELSVQVVKKLLSILKWPESVRFSNTGTEAVMKALMMARAFSGKQRIIKAEGGFHGWSDYMLVSVHPELAVAGDSVTPNTVPESAGLLKVASESTITIPYNNIDAAEKILSQYKDEVAAVIVEPVGFNMGCVLPQEGYLEGLRELTEEHDVLLIFDEVITGFRLAPGGAQEYYNVTPDIATYSKAIANGFPLSAIAGRRDIIEVTRHGAKVAYAGTFNASQTSLAACNATLELVKDGKVQKRLHEATDHLIKGFSQIAEDNKIEARMQGIGGEFQIYFTKEEVINYRTAAQVDKDKYLELQKFLFNEKILFTPFFLFHHGVTYSHTDEDLSNLLKAIETSVKKITD